MDVQNFKVNAGAMDWAWCGQAASACATRCFATSTSTLVLVAAKWSALMAHGATAPSVGARLSVQTNRNHVGTTVHGMSEHAKLAGVGEGEDAAAAEAEAAAWGSTSYSSATDAGDDEVNFHRAAMFAGAVMC